MAKFLKKVTIERINNRFDIEWDLDDVSVLVGVNGSGKTTILNLIRDLLLFKNGVTKYFSHCESIRIEFEDDAFIEFKSINYKNMDFLNEIIKNSVNKELTYINNEVNKGKDKQIVFKRVEKKVTQKLLDQGIVELIRNRMEMKFNFSSEEVVTQFLSEINIEYLSTINLNANSISVTTGSDGDSKSFLDFEIIEEINIFENLNTSIKGLFIKVLNDFLSDSGKIVRSSEANTLMFFYENNKDVLLSFKELSSGERQLLYILLKAVNSYGKKTIFLMDEPEISLHQSWQEKIIENILLINEDCQLIIATHSPAIVMRGWLDKWKDIKEISN